MLPDLGPVAEPVRIPGRPRRRGHRRVLVAAGSATAVLLTGTGVGAAWRTIDQSAPDTGTPAASPPVAAPGGNTPARAVPVDVPPVSPGRPVTGEALAEGACPGITRQGRPATPQRSASPRTAQTPPAPQRGATDRRGPAASGSPVTAGGRAVPQVDAEGGPTDPEQAPSRAARDRPVAATGPTSSGPPTGSRSDARAR